MGLFPLFGSSFIPQLSSFAFGLFRLPIAGVCPDSRRF
jgi:hypothetical protein